MQSDVATSANQRSKTKTAVPRDKVCKRRRKRVALARCWKF
jgi:hypothetical protein